ncbi:MULTISPECIES: formyltetrahydrofolate deformylase [unclassified Sphingomonas]|uniref:formyltetrahydrofolate deformylase n=1 Tax=unclassified Sphingomonas TaxID=196159 RepID=UPI00092AE740|nr:MULTISPECIES: formyltetrahydrofolate deformylase [unclassified Sphingomonas]MBN8847470.1 formyltetrahydrofolate deformylase [Sphingomonas sp.]OJV32659.1 MAG: formyltetrahydrofolate deformylase [Sphingomonas sp. 67-36]
MTKPDFVLLVSCVDRKGIVAAVANSIAAQDCNIVHSAQFGDAESGRFFMRVTFAAPTRMTTESFGRGFLPVAAAFGLEWQVHDLAVKQRALVMVSRGGHCLNDLLYRTATGYLPMEVTSVVSNHEVWRRRVEHEGIAYHCLPVTPESKAAQEEKLLALIAEQRVDLIILARYMQVLSDAACRALEGRVINIHHSSLPAFKGARPYHRAWERGVKLVGATAHYVTPDLDEGPIIAQDVSTVDHADTVDDLIAQGQETESRVLTRAVKAHCEHRVMLNGQRTVVFR